MKKEYRTTKRAGAWVAGRRAPSDGRLWLTDDEAAFELAQKTILPAPRQRRGKKER